MLLIMLCSKDDLPKVDCSTKTNQIDDVKKLIIGTYEWAYTKVTYQIGGTIVQTPSNTGMKYRYLFKSNGQVDYF